MKFYGTTDTISRIMEVNSRLNAVAITTPANAREAKSKWLERANKGIITDPVFTYDTDRLHYIADQLFDLQGLLEDLWKNLNYSENDPKDQFLTDRIRRCTNESLSAVKLAKAIYEGNTDAANAAVYAMFGRPSQFTIEAANRTVRDLKGSTYIPSLPAGPDNLLAEDIARYFRGLLEKANLTGWQCIISPQATAIDVRDADSSIVIPSDRRVTAHKLFKLGGHEFNGHLLGSCNTRAMIEGLLDQDGATLRPLVPWLAKSVREDAYEGVAKAYDVHNEIMYRPFSGPNPELPGPWYTLAIERALSGKGFTDVTEYLIENLCYTGEKEEKAIQRAWTFAYRIFRGSTDTASPEYVFTKDYAYLEGYHAYEVACPEVRTVYRNFSTLDLQTLNSHIVLLQGQKPHYTPLCGDNLRPRFTPSGN